MMSLMSRLVRVVLPAALVILGLPATSHAGTVSEHNIPCEKGTQCAVVTFVAAPGEANDIAITNVPSPDRRSLRLHDAGAPVSVAAPSCHAIDARTVECTGVYGLEVNTGDANDRVTAPGFDDPIDLGPGNDVGVSLSLSGGDGDDTLTGTSLDGGAGNDTLTASGTEDTTLDGGPGADVLMGGPMNDLLVVSDIDADGGQHEPAPDRVDGGPGVNTATYRGRARGVVVDLAAGGGQGAAGEGDTLVNVQNIDGGRGDDRLRGDGGPNDLNGGAGNDRLSGRGGDDLLTGNTGRDALFGGTGDDRLDGSSADGIDLADTKHEALDCGAGADLVESVDLDIIGASCERVEDVGEDVAVNPFPRMTRTLASFRLPCMRGLAVNGRCRGRVRIKNLSSNARRTSSTRRFKQRAGGKIVRLKLARGTRVRLPLRKSVSLQVLITYDLPGLDDIKLSYRIKLPKGCFNPARCSTAALPSPGQPAAL
jgi:RTX calcium-binding nonapeptide repeat (4 copies)